MILLVLIPPNKTKVTITSPDDSDPLKCVDVNCTINTRVIIIQYFNTFNQINSIELKTMQLASYIAIVFKYLQCILNSYSFLVYA